MSRRDAFSEFRSQDESLRDNEAHTPAHVGSRQPLDFIPSASMKKKRSRQWEAEHRQETVTYRGIPKTVLSEILSLSTSLAVPRDEVVRALLEFSLSHYHNGVLQMVAYPRAQRMTLFPENRSGNTCPPSEKSFRQIWLSEAFPATTHPLRGRHKKIGSNREMPAWQMRVTFRIPIGLKEAVRTVASEHNVGVGEVVWRFVIEGLKAYTSGALILNPSPRSIGKTLFPEGQG